MQKSILRDILYIEKIGVILKKEKHVASFHTLEMKLYLMMQKIKTLVSQNLSGL